MESALDRVQALLDERGVDYQLIHHHQDFRARVAARDTHTPAEEFAKTVFVYVDGRPAMAVVPATKDLALSKLGRALGAEDVRLASEAEMHELCPDSEIGAEPPFGILYDLPVYLSASLAEQEHITLNGGTHDKAFRMTYGDYQRIVVPQVLRIAKHD